MRPFETKWEKSFPYLLGILFGLSIALSVTSIYLFRKAAGTGARLPSSMSGGITEQIGQERSGAIVAATRSISPAVVSITALRTEEVLPYPGFGYDFFRRFFPQVRPPRSYTEQFASYGSGLIVNPNGYIITNEHVIRDAEEIYVTLNDGSEAAAALIGFAIEFDLALLRIEARNIPYAPLGDSDVLRIGEWVIAIGSPFGYMLNDTQPTVTVGVVSALNRDVKSSTESSAVFKNMIQTDAAINPGNSGGPLVSSSGEVIGINTFIFSGRDGSNLGISFAIPVNTVKMVYDEIVNYGRVRGIYTGLTVRELTPQVAGALDLPVESGLLVEQLGKDSPAMSAGIEVGDVIVEVNGQTISTIAQANRAIFGLRVGDVLSVVIRRGDAMQTIMLKLSERQRRT